MKLHNACLYFPYQYQTLKNGKVRFKKYTWFTVPHRIIYTFYDGGPYTPIELVKFDPGSRHKIRHWLRTLYGFEFSTFTDKGNPKVDGDELSFLGDAGKDLMRYLKVTKDISEVRGILDIVREDTHSVHGRVDTLGAATHRCTHSSPNVAQTSQDSAFRECYTAPPGMVLVGADLANIEVRVLAHYLYPYDGGQYASAVLSKDMHWYHAGLAGFCNPDDEYDPNDKVKFKQRDKSKKFFFGLSIWCMPNFINYDENKQMIVINK